MNMYEVKLSTPEFLPLLAFATNWQLEQGKFPFCKHEALKFTLVEML